jgi:hypothetical protein
MNTRRIFLALFACALLLPLAGCRHNRCCGNQSYAPPPCNSCGTGAVPPGYVPAP